MPTKQIELDYELLAKQLQSLLEGEQNLLANTANLTGLLYYAMSDVNWLGVYVLRGNELVLGPFQGKPACVRIPLGRGVCGVAAQSADTQRVDDVNEFAGHIVCDPDSVSELVVPLIHDGAVIGVLDIDSPMRARFSESDEAGIELICRIFLQSIRLPATATDEFI